MTRSPFRGHLDPQRPAAPWEQGNFWGQYQTAADLVSVAGARFQLDSLQAGDIAWVVDDGLLYVCTDPTVGAAIWMPLAFLGPATEDHQTAKLIVGNAANGDDAAICDILDPGDGSGIRQALVDITTNFPEAIGDIFIRAGTYNVASEVEINGAFQVPPGVRVIGAGKNQTVLTGSGLQRSVFDLNTAVGFVRNSLVDVGITCPAALEGASGLEVVLVGGLSEVTRVLAEFPEEISNAQLINESLVTVFRVPAPGAPPTLNDVQTRFVPGRLRADTNLSHVSSIDVIDDALIADCVLDGGDIGVRTDSALNNLPRISDSLIEGWSWYGVFAEVRTPSFAPVENLLVEGCRIFGNPASGLPNAGLTSAGVTIISGQEQETRLHTVANNAFFNSDVGVYVRTLAGSTRLVTIAGNTFRQHIHAVWLEAGTDSNVVTTNTAVDISNAAAYRDDSLGSEVAHNIDV